jgi:hypothetical protein
MAMIQCAHCIHFLRDRDNPAAAMGDCGIGLGYWFPGERHSCRRFEEAKR